MENFSGVLAALVTPVTESGRIDFGRLEQIVDFVLGRGVRGICLGGATSEFPHFELEERKELITAVSRQVAGRGWLVTAVGALTLHQIQQLGEHALASGSQALLLPMPYFYRYGQEDLEHFCRENVRRLDAPWMIYNLPSFTNPLRWETIYRLLLHEPRIVGVKDSSGDLEIQQRLAEARRDRPFTLLVGSDSVFLPGLKQGWDGVISGVASFCPELLVALYENFVGGDLEGAEECQRLLEELIAQVDRLPFPWGIRAGQEVRGIPTGPRAFPLSSRRREEEGRLKAWLEGWLDQHLPRLQQVSLEARGDSSSSF